MTGNWGTSGQVDIAEYHIETGREMRKFSFHSHKLKGSKEGKLKYFGNYVIGKMHNNCNVLVDLNDERIYAFQNRFVRISKTKFITVCGSQMLDLAMREPEVLPYKKLGDGDSFSIVDRFSGVKVLQRGRLCHLVVNNKISSFSFEGYPEFFRHGVLILRTLGMVRVLDFNDQSGNK